MRQRECSASQVRSVTSVWNSALSYRPNCVPMRSALRENFRCVRVLLGRSVTGLFEQRHVHHRRGVALRAGITVPVPRAAEVAAFLDDAHVANARFDQPRTGHETGETAADERERDVIGLRRAFDERRVRIFEVVRELSRNAQVLLVAVGAQSLVAFLQVLCAQRVLVDLARGGFVCRHVVVSLLRDQTNGFFGPFASSPGGRSASQYFRSPRWKSVGRATRTPSAK